MKYYASLIFSTNFSHSSVFTVSRHFSSWLLGVEKGVDGIVCHSQKGTTDLKKICFLILFGKVNTCTSISGISMLLYLPTKSL